MPAPPSALVPSPAGEASRPFRVCRVGQPAQESTAPAFGWHDACRSIPLDGSRPLLRRRVGRAGFHGLSRTCSPGVKTAMPVVVQGVPDNAKCVRLRQPERPEGATTSPHPSVSPASEVNAVWGDVADRSTQVPSCASVGDGGSEEARQLSPQRSQTMPMASSAVARSLGSLRPRTLRGACRSKLRGRTRRRSGTPLGREGGRGHGGNHGLPDPFLPSNLASQTMPSESSSATRSGARRFLLQSVRLLAIHPPRRNPSSVTKARRDAEMTIGGVVRVGGGDPALPWRRSAPRSSRRDRVRQYARLERSVPTEHSAGAKPSSELEPILGGEPR